MKDIFKLCRVKQWIKNAFVFAAVIFSGKLLSKNYLIKSFGAFIAFCLISSAIYILNDIKDVEEDKKHPKKKHRPIASEKISVKKAFRIFLIITITALIISYSINWKLTLIILIYFFINILYTYKLKKVIIIDVMTIAIGFILRVAAGGVATEIYISSWLTICTGLISLYLGFGKRKNEIIVLNEEAENHRKILSEYTVEYLDKILLIMLGLTIMTYILYTIYGTTYKNMIYTIPFVIYGTLRYEYLITNKNLGGSPEDIFIQDKPFLINIVCWILICILAIYL